MEARLNESGRACMPCPDTLLPRSGACRSGSPAPCECKALSNVTQQHACTPSEFRKQDTGTHDATRSTSQVPGAHTREVACCIQQPSKAHAVKSRAACARLGRRSVSGA